MFCVSVVNVHFLNALRRFLERYSLDMSIKDTLKYRFPNHIKYVVNPMSINMEKTILKVHILFSYWSHSLARRLAPWFFLRALPTPHPPICPSGEVEALEAEIATHASLQAHSLVHSLSLTPSPFCLSNKRGMNIRESVNPLKALNWPTTLQLLRYFPNLLGQF